MTVRTNWAGNITFGTARLHTPTSLEQLQHVVAASSRVRAIGTGHSFNPIADTIGNQVCLASMPNMCVVDTQRSTVTVGAGMRYGELADRLQDTGYALAALGSLPHISVGGAIATGTHGSGDSVGSLATAVSALQIVTSDGSLLATSRETAGEEFRGAVIALGALGIVTTVTLDVVPSFEVRQWVYDDLPVAAVHDHAEEVFASAYSVSLFTDWRSDSFRQVWLKQRLDECDVREPRMRWLGATLADGPRHPIAGMPVENTTEQLGVPGPWHARLPHFRREFTPSSGDELQSEYLLPREHMAGALAALGRARDRFAPLVQVSEVRTVAGDDLWLSPSYGRDTVAIHFTWRPDAVAVTRVLDIVERQLEPFFPRPHWGKLFTNPSDGLASRYDRSSDFTALMRRHDPTGKFRNELLDSWFPSAASGTEAGE